MSIISVKTSHKLTRSLLYQFNEKSQTSCVNLHVTFSLFSSVAWKILSRYFYLFTYICMQTDKKKNCQHSRELSLEYVALSWTTSILLFPESCQLWVTSFFFLASTYSPQHLDVRHHHLYFFLVLWLRSTIQSFWLILQRRKSSTSLTVFWFIPIENCQSSYRI